MRFPVNSPSWLTLFANLEPDHLDILLRLRPIGCSPRLHRLLCAHQGIHPPCASHEPPNHEPQRSLLAQCLRLVQHAPRNLGVGPPASANVHGPAQRARKPGSPVADSPGFLVQQHPQAPRRRGDCSANGVPVQGQGDIQLRSQPGRCQRD